MSTRTPGPIEHALELAGQHGFIEETEAAEAELRALRESYKDMREALKAVLRDARFPGADLSALRLANEAIAKAGQVSTARRQGALEEKGPPYLEAWKAGGCVQCGCADRGPDRQRKNFYFCDGCFKGDIREKWMDACDAIAREQAPTAREMGREIWRAEIEVFEGDER